MRILIPFLFAGVLALAAAGGEPPVVIDYMVLYTPAAETLAGGDAAMLEQISNGVASVNTALTNSGLGYISYRLVHTQRLSGNNTTNDLGQAIQELYRLDPIADIRDTYRADSVSFIFEQLSVGAYASIPLSTHQATLSYSYFGVQNYDGFVPAHELGHNMGGFHNNPNPEPAAQAGATNGATDAPYGYAFIGTNGVHYKTLMSAYFYSPFDPTGQVVLVNCGRYSNPRVTYQGAPTGKAGYADMASVIAYWAPLIATTYSDTPSAPSPVIKANDTRGTLTVQYPTPVSVTVELTPGQQAGTNADWWVLAIPNAGGTWYYRDNAARWQAFPANDLNACQPAYQGPLTTLSATTVLPATILPVGVYTVYFAVDTVMDGTLDYPGGPLWYDTVTVTVQAP